MSGPKILVLDIETMAAKVYAWGLWNQNIGISQIIEHDRMIAFGAQWVGDKRVIFHSEFHSKGVDIYERRVEMAGQAFALLNEADVVVTYNGNRFDIPWLQRTFSEYGLGEPAPFVSVDLYRTLKGRHRWLSHKLAYITERLALSGKLKHEGFEMWAKCDDPTHPDHAKAWAQMRKYCKRDVVTTGELFQEALPLISTLPSHALFSEVGDGGKPTCPNCGSDVVQRRGYAYTKTRKYPRFQCQSCGKWFKGTRSELGVGAA